MRRLALALAVVAALAGCADPAVTAATAATAATTDPTTAPPAEVLVAAVGDIAGSGADDDAVGRLVDAASPEALITLGDNAYSSGSLAQYQTYYEPVLGRHKAITYPTPGNHDYYTSGAAGMRAYFGDRWPADYYSFDLGTWHLVSLNSEIDTSATSPQVQWLRADLAATSQPCILAYWHSPRFSSGAKHGSDPSVAPLWQALADARADVVLAGHEHNAEQFAKLSPAGQPEESGIRSFVLGTGGYDTRHYRFGRTVTGSQVRIGPSVAGIGLFTLGDGHYSWRFQPIPAHAAVDPDVSRFTGSDTCHP